MAAVVTLAILSLMISATAWQILANRRMLHHRRYELQSAWLARSGVERARARLLATPTGYDGETVEMIPLSRVRIEVKPEPDSPDTFLIASEARYPTDATDVVVRSVSRRFKRQVDGKVVTLELLPGGE